MKIVPIAAAAVLGVVLGAFAGWHFAKERFRAALLCGPYGDNYGPAIAAIDEARRKLRSGDPEVLRLLDEARTQIEEARKWSRRYLGHSEEAK